MDNDKARSIVAAGKAHGQGGVIRLLLAYCAGREPDPRAWLTHIQGLAERKT
ncbi:hypothetical protein [Nitrobacter sp. Nb-311A]|uniref:hypothetical protein n=1 Tax=Nitrobacter sp. Nb-311A TaxID=314253 RepID=UPI0013EF76BF|nr:hypothetical protein [Nitrobacter sp. Nb-311A]